MLKLVGDGTVTTDTTVTTTTTGTTSTTTETVTSATASGSSTGTSESGESGLTLYGDVNLDSRVDRICVMCNGKLTGEIDQPEEMTQARVMGFATKF